MDKKLELFSCKKNVGAIFFLFFFDSFGSERSKEDIGEYDKCQK